MKVLLDNSVVDCVHQSLGVKKHQLLITSQTDNDSPDYRKKYPNLQVIPNVARFGHSIWDGGEVWGSEYTTYLSNELLALASNQKYIKYISEQTNRNQRDDADIIVAAIINKCDHLISNDKKFMLKKLLSLCLRFILI